MVNWMYNEPDEWGNTSTVVISEDAIIEQYWNYWSTEMLKAHKSPMITKRNCIEDFVIVNWATQCSTFSQS